MKKKKKPKNLQLYVIWNWYNENYYKFPFWGDKDI